MFDYWQGWHIALMLLMTAISIVLIIICLKIKRRRDQEVIIVRNVQSMYQPPMYPAMNPQAAYQHPNAMRSQQAFVPSQPYPVYVQQVIPQYQHLYPAQANLSQEQQVPSSEQNKTSKQQQKKVTFDVEPSKQSQPPESNTKK